MSFIFFPLALSNTVGDAGLMPSLFLRKSFLSYGFDVIAKRFPGETAVFL